MRRACLCNIDGAIEGRSPWLKVEQLDSSNSIPENYITLERCDKLLPVAEATIYRQGQLYYVDPSKVMVLRESNAHIVKHAYKAYIGDADIETAKYLQKELAGTEISPGVYACDWESILVKDGIAASKVEINLKTYVPDTKSIAVDIASQELAPLIVSGDMPDLRSRLEKLSRMGIDLSSVVLYRIANIVEKRYVFGEFILNPTTNNECPELKYVAQLANKINQSLRIKLTTGIIYHRGTETLTNVPPVPIEYIDGISRSGTKSGTPQQIFLSTDLRGIYPEKGITFTKDIVGEHYIIPACERKRSDYVYIDKLIFGEYKLNVYPEYTDRRKTLFSPIRQMAPRAITRKLISCTKLLEKCAHAPNCFFHPGLPQSKIIEYDTLIRASQVGDAWLPITLIANGYPKCEISNPPAKTELVYWGISLISASMCNINSISTNIERYIANLYILLAGSKKYTKVHYILNLANINTGVVYKAVCAALGQTSSKPYSAWKYLYSQEAVKYMRTLEISNV